MSRRKGNGGGSGTIGNWSGPGRWTCLGGFKAVDGVGQSNKRGLKLWIVSVSPTTKRSKWYQMIVFVSGPFAGRSCWVLGCLSV